MTVYLDGKSWRWRFTYKGERYSGSAPAGANTKKNALAIEKHTLDRLVARENIGIKPTLTAFSVMYLEHQKVNTKPLTYRTHEGAIRLHLLPTLGKMKIDEIGTLEIDQLAAEWTDAAPPTRNLRLRVLKRMLSLAVEWEMLAKTPKFRRVSAMTTEAPRFLTDAESYALAGAADGEWKPMVVVALRTGMRVGELRGLYWTDIDFARGRIVIARTSAGIPGMPPTKPKGGKSRVVPLTPDAKAALESIERTGKSVWPGDFDGRGRPPSVYHEAIKRAVKASSIERGEEVAWHTLRHTFASQLAIRGTSLRVIQELLGHSTITLTEIYAHLLPGATHHAAVAALDTPYVEPTLALPSGEKEDE